MSPPEIVSELMYNGKSLQEIAGYDYYILQKVLMRRRDKMGRLIRSNSDLPPGAEVDHPGMRVIRNKISYADAFVRSKRQQGLSLHESKQQWNEFAARDPRARKG